MEEKTKKYPSLHRKLFYVEPINTDFIKARPGEHFHMKMSFPNASYANKTYLHMKGCTPSIVLVTRHTATGKNGQSRFQRLRYHFMLK